MNFKTTSIGFLIAFCLFVFLHHYFHISLWWILLPIVVYKAIFIYGVANIQANFFTKAYCSSNTTEKIIAISFDDGPNSKYTPKVLETLAQYSVPATFFVIGKNIHGNEELLKRMDAAGHTIGNHTYSHSFFIDMKSKFGFMYELDQTSDLVFNIIGKRMKFFRPPYGVTTRNLAKAAKILNYYIIGWNVRSLDTKKDSEEMIAKRVLTQVKPGALILFHDTSEKTVNVLLQTLNFAKDNGFKVVSAAELLKLNPYE